MAQQCESPLPDIWQGSCRPTPFPQHKSPEKHEDVTRKVKEEEHEIKEEENEDENKDEKEEEDEEEEINRSSK